MVVDLSFFIYFFYAMLLKTWFVFLCVVEKEWEHNGSHPLLLSPHISLSLPVSSQSSVYVAAVAGEDGGEKIMLSGTLGGNSLKLK